MNKLSLHHKQKINLFGKMIGKSSEVQEVIIVMTCLDKKQKIQVMNKLSLHHKQKINLFGKMTEKFSEVHHQYSQVHIIQNNHVKVRNYNAPIHIIRIRIIKDYVKIHKNHVLNHKNHNQIVLKNIEKIEYIE